jgi:hypothetical protein
MTISEANILFKLLSVAAREQQQQPSSHLFSPFGVRKAAFSGSSDLRMAFVPLLLPSFLPSMPLQCEPDPLSTNLTAHGVVVSVTIPDQLHEGHAYTKGSKTLDIGSDTVDSKHVKICGL